MGTAGRGRCLGGLPKIGCTHNPVPYGSSYLLMIGDFIWKGQAFVVLWFVRFLLLIRTLHHGRLKRMDWQLRTRTSRATVSHAPLQFSPTSWSLVAFAFLCASSTWQHSTPGCTDEHQDHQGCQLAEDSEWLQDRFDSTRRAG